MFNYCFICFLVALADPYLMLMVSRFAPGLREAIDNNIHDIVSCQIIRIDSLPTRDANEVLSELTRVPFPPPNGRGMSIDDYEILDQLHTSTMRLLYKIHD